jgi:hypothetical protein
MTEDMLGIIYFNDSAQAAPKMASFKHKLTRDILDSSATSFTIHITVMALYTLKTGHRVV